MIVLLLGLGLLALLLLNTASAQDAFRLSDLQRQSKGLSDQQQALARQAQALSDPASIAAAAGTLGMVPGGPPTFLPPGAKVPAGHVVGGMIYVPGPAVAKVPARKPAAAKPPAKPPASKPPAKTPAATNPAAAAVLAHMTPAQLAQFKKFAKGIAQQQAAASAATKTATGTAGHP